MSTLTVKSQVRQHWLVSTDEDYRFCRSPGCEAVYFGSTAVFYKADLKARVGLKEREDPLPLCYCFDYTRADVRREVEDRGRSEILERIRTEVKAGFCACEVKNPSGGCCLAEVEAAIREAKAGLASSPPGAV